MIRALLLLVTAVLALAAPAGACSFSLSIPQSPPSDYERVDAAERIVLARPVEALGDDEVRFAVEEVLKGEAGRTLLVQGSLPGTEAARDPWCILQALGCFREDGLYLLFLDQENLRGQQPEPDDDWRRTIRLFAGISALDDPEQERKALRELRKAAAEDRSGRYPKGLARRIDRHFALPSPGKPFSELMDFYQAAETDGERLEALWALYHGDHPETPGFFRGLLFGGGPAGLLEPLTTWFEGDHADELPRIEDLARIYLAYPPDERGPVLELIARSAEPEDEPLLWSLLAGSTRDEIAFLVEAALELASEATPGWPGWLDLPPDEGQRTELIAFWLSSPTWEGKERLGELLRGEGRWRSARSPDELASLFEASTEPAERRQILVEIFSREDEADEKDLSLLWRLLLHARDREADLLLQRIADSRPADGELEALYRAARTEEERDKALWILGAVSTSDPLRRRQPQELVRAFLSCPHSETRFNLASEAANLAGATDLPLMLEALYAGTEDDARALAEYFSWHPSPEAIQGLRRALVPPFQGDPEVREALAASGDPEIVSEALRILRSPGREDDHWAKRILSRSPLPAAAEP